MKRKTSKRKQEKAVEISVGEITKAGFKVLGKVLKTADEIKRSKLIIRVEKE